MFAQAGGPYYAVKKGRKDSKVSLAGKVRVSLPRANSTVDELLRVFAGKGLGAADLVALSGGHTVGIAHCISFGNRLFPTQDPTLNKFFAGQLCTGRARPTRR